MAYPTRHAGACRAIHPRDGPWGIRYTLAPGEKVEIVAQGRWRDGEPSIERTDEGLEFQGWNGSWATVVPEPPPKPPASPRASPLGRPA